MFDALQKLFDLYILRMLFIRLVSGKLFSKLNYFCFGYFDPTNIFFYIIKISNFRGDPSDISAKTATLAGMLELEGTRITYICSVVFF